METKTHTPPAKTFYCKPVYASIWCESKVIDNEKKELHSIKFSRCYKDHEEWKYTDTFRPDDLPKLAVVSTEAYKFIRLRSSEKNDES
jgi:hypothetical protein